MKLIVLPMLLLFIVNYPSPYGEINLEEILAKKNEEEKMIQNKRKLSNGKVVYINPESIITIYNDCIIETISVTVKAEGGIVTNFYINPAAASQITILSCELKMKNDQGKVISTFSNMTNCSVSYSSSLHITTYLKENYEQTVKATFKGFFSKTNYDVLYQQILINVPNIFKNKTHCKYIFNVDSNSANIGLEYGKFSVFNDSDFIYDDL